MAQVSCLVLENAGDDIRSCCSKTKTHRRGAEIAEVTQRNGKGFSLRCLGVLRDSAVKKWIAAQDLAQRTEFYDLVSWGGVLGLISLQPNCDAFEARCHDI